jgi:Flp pilus assembly protein TadB
LNFDAFLMLVLVVSVWTTAAYISLPKALLYRATRRRDENNIRTSQQQLQDNTARIDELLTELRAAGTDEERTAARDMISQLTKQNENIATTLQYHRRSRQANRFGEVPHFAAVLGFFLLGLFMLQAVMPVSTIALFLAALLCFGGCIWLARHYGGLRQQWRTNPPPGRLAHGGHGSETVVHLAGVALLPVIGILLLIAIF